MKRPTVRIVLSTAVALLTVGGAVTYSAVSAAGADHSAETDIWGDDLPAELVDDPAGDLGRGRTDTPLRKMLLPVPDSHRLGPEAIPFGSNDGELDGRATTRLMKQQQQGLTGAERRRFETAVDRLGLQGMVWRTYAQDEVADHVTEVQIVRLRNAKDAKALFALQTGVLRALKVAKGPVVGGHKSAICFKGATSGPGTENDLVVYACYAYRSDTVVSVEFNGSRELYPSVVAGFVKKQLDHIASPGEYV
ncbi:hypothetical protein ACIQ9E_11150 [Streptomyces sp. NPDC094448]|uniref:hypothetical protein n=1 Tax=Streptomyces sp. NPDC094448 TaxID=3366063 RepID=UPI0038122BFD